jgi:hypothetical protein
MNLMDSLVENDNIMVGNLQPTVLLTRKKKMMKYMAKKMRVKTNWDSHENT